MLTRWDVTTGPSSTVTSPTYSDGTPNTGNGEPNAGAQPNLTPAITLLSQLPASYETTKLNRPGFKGSKKGVKA
jgi:hypothetical protein